MGSVAGECWLPASWARWNLCGGGFGNSTVAAVMLTAVWAFVAGMMWLPALRPGDLATISLVALVVFMRGR